MNIIQIGNYPENPLLMKGGIQASVYGISQELSINNNVTVLGYPNRDLKHNYTKKDKKVIVHFFKNPYKWDILSVLLILKFLKKIRSHKPDIVHIHGSSLLSCLISIFLKISRIRCVTTIHGIHFIEDWKKWKKNKSYKYLISLFIFGSIELILVNLGGHIIVDTEYVRLKLKKITFKKLYVIPQGINSSFFKIEDNPKTFNLLSIGVISERKGYLYSIDAVSEVKKRFPNISYNIVGVLPKDNLLHYNQIVKKIKDLDLNNNVSIYINQEEEIVKKLLSEASIFILHSHEESQGIVFCEAMAAGKPIVATNVGGIPYVVEHNINGKLSEYGDVTTFAENINSILTSDRLREIISNTNKISAKRYSWSLITKSIYSIYCK